MWPRLEWLAAIRTALLLQVFTAISPPKLFTSRQAPARTGTVVSVCCASARPASVARVVSMLVCPPLGPRSEEHTSELQSQSNLVCRLLLEKKKKKNKTA